MIRLLAAVALTSATVLTGEGPPLEDATVLIEGNRVAAVGKDVRIPPGATVIEAAGHVVSPGLVDGASRLGLVEVALESSTVEGTAGSSHDPVRAALRAWDTFNPASRLIPVARQGGLTSAVIVPRGGLVSGQSAWVDLVEDSPVRKAPTALHVSVSGLGGDAGARSRAFLRLREVLEETRLYAANRGPYIARRLRDLSVSASDLDVLAQAEERELLVVIDVDRASDIQSVLEVVREYRLRAALMGVDEGWVVAADIARAGVPVLLDPLQNLPRSYSSLRARSDNAARLHEAGVHVAFSLLGRASMEHRLRQLAGNSVAAGFPYDAAISAITRVPAEIYGMVDAGTIRPGSLANLVVWNGDPLEVTTWPIRMFIRGQEVELRSRQDLLTERYRTEPPAPPQPLLDDAPPVDP
jgi:imidazolonepropionase-like amidohydrolase